MVAGIYIHIYIHSYILLSQMFDSLERLEVYWIIGADIPCKVQCGQKILHLLRFLDKGTSLSTDSSLSPSHKAIHTSYVPPADLSSRISHCILNLSCFFKCMLNEETKENMPRKLFFYFVVFEVSNYICFLAVMFQPPKKEHLC